MSKELKSKNAFTLIEVMVAVMIISVVIMALIQMYANNTHIFSSFKKQTKINQYTSFFLANDTYGYEDKSVSLYELVREFNIHNELRQELKFIKVKLVYEELQQIDLSESQSSEIENEETSNMIFEVGKTTLQSNSSSSSLLRFKL